MNQKKAKAFRAEVRRNGFHPRDAKYDRGPSHFIAHPFDPRGGAMFLGHVKLKPGCGRALYRQMKRDARRAAA